MAMQPIASVILPEQDLPERFIAALRVAVRKARPVAVLALGLALVPMPTQAAFGQLSPQQEQQQRDERQREEQQREQQERDRQQREQQEREQQQREEQERQQEQREQQQREQEQRNQQQREEQQREQQQREEQQRDQQQREQQQREQQQREQQAREQQQREEQQREQQQREVQERQQQQRDQELKAQQQREQQARDQQQREEQQREQQQREAQERQQQQRDQELKAQQREQQAHDPQQPSSDFPVPSSKSGPEVSHATVKAPAADLKRAPSNIQSAGTERKPDTSLPIKPAPHPVEPKAVPEVAKKTCKDGPCQPCSSTQAKDKKDGSCEAAAVAKAGAAAAPKVAGPQSCAAGQVWNGAQCLSAGAQPPCTPGQIGSASCQAQCITAFTAAQGYIDLLRNARQQKDDACLKDQMSKECSEAELDYSTRISEYRGYLGVVPIGCQSTLPDPSAI